MRCHLLRLFEIPAIGQVNRDPGCPEQVTADLGLDPGCFSPALNHSKSVFAVERPIPDKILVFPFEARNNGLLGPFLIPAASM